MTLKFKLTNHLTAVAQITNEERTECIFSDECSTDAANTLRILAADTPEDLHTMIKELTIELASHTRFSPVVCYVSDDAHQIEKLTVTATQAANIF